MVTKKTTTKKSAPKRAVKKVTARKRNTITYIDMKMNGVLVTLYPNVALKKFYDDSRNYLRINNEYAMFIGDKNRDDLYTAAGYNTRKIDFAVPLQWIDLPENRSRANTGDRPVWSYEVDRFGGPIWDSEMLKELASEIKSRIRNGRGITYKKLSLP